MMATSMAATSARRDFRMEDDGHAGALPRLLSTWSPAEAGGNDDDRPDRAARVRAWQGQGRGCWGSLCRATSDRHDGECTLGIPGILAPPARSVCKAVPVAPGGLSDA